MTESSIRLSANFDNIELAQNIEKLLIDAKEQILASLKDGAEFYLHDYLNQQNQNMGISFDSWWVPGKIELINNVVEIELLGSPSGTKEQDIITWLRLKGASNVNGEMSIGGADPETWKVGDSVDGEDEDDEEIDIDYRDGAGHSLLHLAAEMGNAKRVQMIVEKGADIEARNNANNTPIFMPINDDISFDEAVGCIDILLEAGADINAVGVRDFTPLGWAKRRGYKEITKYLKKRGAK
jgi:Ankyrin repeats (3 copies)